MNQVAKFQRQFSVAELYMLGYSQDKIAAELGLAQATVSADIKALHVLWAEPLKEKAHELKNRFLARLELVEKMAWERYRSTGLSTHARTVMKCIEMQMKVHGLLTQKVDLNVTNQIPWDDLAATVKPEEQYEIAVRLKQYTEILRTRVPQLEVSHERSGLDQGAG